MKLWHFSEELVNDLYNKPQKIGEKPRGLWLSDETDYGWAKWCTAKQVTFTNIATNYVYEVELDLTDILYLSSIEDIKTVPAIDSHPNMRYFYGDSVYWTKIAENWKGILITPYQWECRLLFETIWYYTWDCASGCIWDVSCITSFKLLGQYGLQSGC